MSILPLSLGSSPIGQSRQSASGNEQPANREAPTNTGAPPSSSTETQASDPVPPPESSNKTEAATRQRGDDASIDGDAKIQVAAAPPSRADAAALTEAALTATPAVNEEATARAAALAYQEQFRMEQVVTRVFEKDDVADLAPANAGDVPEETAAQGNPFAADAQDSQQLAA